MYTLQMRDDGGASETVELDTHSRMDIESECEDWAEGGAWGDNGCVVSVYWTLVDADGEMIDRGSMNVQIEPDHSALIQQAVGNHLYCCGDHPDQHQWTSAGEGGCRENEGVWSMGGTTLVISVHCRRCGLRRIETNYGTQRNLINRIVRYEMPEQWCSECQSAECRCG